MNLKCNLLCFLLDNDLEKCDCNKQSILQKLRFVSECWQRLKDSHYSTEPNIALRST